MAQLGDTMVIGNLSTTGTIYGPIADSGNGCNITFAYSKAGLTGTINWLAAWNGYELRAVAPSNLKVGGICCSVTNNQFYSNITQTYYCCKNGNITYEGYYNEGYAELQTNNNGTTTTTTITSDYIKSTKFCGNLCGTACCATNACLIHQTIFTSADAYWNIPLWSNTETYLPYRCLGCLGSLKACQDSSNKVTFNSDYYSGELLGNNKSMYSCVGPVPNNTRRYILVCFDTTNCGVTNAVSACFEIDIYTSKYFIWKDGTTLRNWWCNTGLSNTSTAYGSYCAGKTADDTSTTNCFWITYSNYRAPVIKSARKISIVCNTTTAPTGVTFTAPTNMNVLCAVCLYNRPSSNEASKICNVYFYTGCTNASCSPTNFAACICGANNWMYGLAGIFAPYVRANSPGSTASKVCNVVINSYCTNASCTLTTRTFTFCGSTGYMHGNVCGNLCGLASKSLSALCLCYAPSEGVGNVCLIAGCANGRCYNVWLCGENGYLYGIAGLGCLLIVSPAYLFSWCPAENQNCCIQIRACCCNNSSLVVSCYTFSGTDFTSERKICAKGGIVDNNGDNYTTCTGTVTSVNVSVNGTSGTAITSNGTVTLTNVYGCVNTTTYPGACCKGTVTVLDKSASTYYDIALCTGTSSIGRSTRTCFTFNPDLGVLRISENTSLAGWICVGAINATLIQDVSVITSCVTHTCLSSSTGTALTHSYTCVDSNYRKIYTLLCLSCTACMGTGKSYGGIINYSKCVSTLCQWSPQVVMQVAHSIPGCAWNSTCCLDYGGFEGSAFATGSCVVYTIYNRNGSTNLFGARFLISASY